MSLAVGGGRYCLMGRVPSLHHGGANEPSADEKVFLLARRARCVPLVAARSISSLRSALSGESWRMLLQGLRTKILLLLPQDIARGRRDGASEKHPIRDARLPDASRVAAGFPPYSLGGTTPTSRKFQTRLFTTEELVWISTLTLEEMTTVRQAIDAGSNICDHVRNQHL